MNFKLSLGQLFVAKGVFSEMTSVMKCCKSPLKLQQYQFLQSPRFYHARSHDLSLQKIHRNQSFRVRIYTPSCPEPQTSDLGGASGKSECFNQELISREDVSALEQRLLKGEGIQALVHFNNALRSLTKSNWEPRLTKVFREWCFNLESFNPAFAAVLLQVQLSIGESDYDRRDNCLKCLIQPLAGEYGMHNNEPQSKTHRQLFRDFYLSLYPDSSISALLNPKPIEAKILFRKMIHDIQSHGDNPVERACYALGYNLAIEYLADYEKRWMLHSFQQLNVDVIDREMDWVFLEIHAEDEKEHAEIGYDAVLSLVPKSKKHLVEQAMRDHDRDFAIFYNYLTTLLQ